MNSKLIIILLQIYTLRVSLSIILETALSKKRQLPTQCWGHPYHQHCYIYLSSSKVKLSPGFSSHLQNPLFWPPNVRTTPGFSTLTSVSIYTLFQCNLMKSQDLKWQIQNLGSSSLSPALISPNHRLSYPVMSSASPLDAKWTFRTVFWLYSSKLFLPQCCPSQ